MYITEPLHRLITAVQLAAGVNAILGIITFSVFLGAEARNDLVKDTVLIYGTLCLGTAVALFVLVRFMNRGKVWAYAATWVVAALLAVQVLLDVAAVLSGNVGLRISVRGLFCFGVLHLPHLYVVIAAIDSYAEVRSVLRQARRARLERQRAFEPIMTPPPPPALPPRPRRRR